MKRFHAGNVIIIGFVLAACSMLWLAYQTTKVHFDMSTTGDYYQAESLVNADLLAQKHGQHLGDDFKIIDKEGKISVQIAPRLSNQLEKGNISFYCYSDSRLDTTLVLTASKDGVYVFDKSEIMPGKNYKVNVSFQSNQIPYAKQIMVP